MAMNAPRDMTALRALAGALIPFRAGEPVPGLSGWRRAYA
jgi:hypothetical protein